jgi:hypothetical protein
MLFFQGAPTNMSDKSDIAESVTFAFSTNKEVSPSRDI